MRDYELISIISPELDEEGISRIIEKVNKSIGDRGGKVSETSRWGKRRLAYQFKKFLEGNYILTRFKLEPKSVKEVSAEIKTSEGVLRHLVVKIGD